MTLCGREGISDIHILGNESFAASAKRVILFRENAMKIKMFCSSSETNFEDKVNGFITENEGKIEVVDIKWRIFLFHYAMIVYKEI